MSSSEESTPPAVPGKAAVPGRNAVPGRSAVSRRGLIAAAGAVGVAATAATVVGVAVTSAGATSADHTASSGSGTPEEKAADGALVVHVRDVATGTLDVFTGTTHHQLRDPDLAARLAAAARQES